MTLDWVRRGNARHKDARMGTAQLMTGAARARGRPVLKAAYSIFHRDDQVWFLYARLVVCGRRKRAKGETVQTGACGSHLWGLVAAQLWVAVCTGVDLNHLSHIAGDGFDLICAMVFAAGEGIRRDRLKSKLDCSQLAGTSKLYKGISQGRGEAQGTWSEIAAVRQRATRALEVPLKWSTIVG